MAYLPQSQWPDSIVTNSVILKGFPASILILACPVRMLVVPRRIHQNESIPRVTAIPDVCPWGTSVFLEEDLFSHLFIEIIHTFFPLLRRDRSERGNEVDGIAIYKLAFALLNISGCRFLSQQWFWMILVTFPDLKCATFDICYQNKCWCEISILRVVFLNNLK